MEFKDFSPYIAPLVIAALFARRIFAQPKLRRIRPGTLWIAPVYVAVLMAFLLWTNPAPSPFGMALFAVAAAVGLVAGYLRALYQEFSMSPTPATS